MKKVISVLAVLAILMGCNLLSGNSPAKVVQEFHRLVEKGELSKAYELVSQSGKGLLAMAGGAQGLSSGTNEIKQKGGIKNIKIIKEDVTGEMATVNFEITYGNGSVKKDNEKLIKEDGKWKLDVSK